MPAVPATPRPPDGDNARIASPCVNVCRINERNGLCEGCQRTLDEIASWPEYGDDERRAVLAKLSARRSPQRQDPAAP